MPWRTVTEASEEGPFSRATLERRIAAGLVPSYLDESGRRMVWTELSPEMAHRAEREAWLEELSELRRELAKLRAELGDGDRETPASPVILRDVPASPAGAEPQRTTRPLGASEAELLELVAKASLSDREIEKRAGLPKAFLAKAKRGERSGPQSAASWERLRSFLRSHAAA